MRVESNRTLGCSLPVRNRNACYRRGYDESLTRRTRGFIGVNSREAVVDTCQNKEVEQSC